MKRLFLDLTTTIDDEAANRCDYAPSPRAPMPLVLHLIENISMFQVEHLWTGELWTASEPLGFAARSWALEENSEKAILEHCREACLQVDEVVTLGGERFELPVLFARSLVHGVPTDAFTSRHRRHAAWRFHDRPAETTTAGLVAIPGLAELCAPLGIGIQPGEDVALSLASVGEARAKALWLLDEYWTHGNSPEMVRARRAMLATGP